MGLRIELNQTYFIQVNNGQQQFGKALKTPCKRGVLTVIFFCCWQQSVFSFKNKNFPNGEIDEEDDEVGDEEDGSQKVGDEEEIRDEKGDERPK